MWLSFSVVSFQTLQSFDDCCRFRCCEIKYPGRGTDLRTLLIRIRWRSLRNGALPFNCPSCRDQKAAHPNLDPNLLAWHWLQLACVPGLLPWCARQGLGLQDCWNLVAYVCFHPSWIGPRHRKHVLYTHGYISENAQSYGGFIHLERYVAIWSTSPGDLA